MIMHPVSVGLHSAVSTWHWLWGSGKVLRIETSAFTLFQQLTVSRKTRPWGRASSGFIEVEKRSSHGLTFQQQRITVRIISVQILSVTAVIHPDCWEINVYRKQLERGKRYNIGSFWGNFFFFPRGHTTPRADRDIPFGKACRSSWVNEV